MHEIWSVDSQKIVKFVATRCQILRLNSISAGALPQTLLGSLQHSPDLLAVFKRSTSKGERKKGREAEKGQGMEE